MGEELFGEVTEATGLPKNTIGKELETLLNSAGLARADLTLDELREVLAQYVQDVLVEAKEHLQETQSEACEK